MENIPRFHLARRLACLAAGLFAVSCACHDRPVSPIGGSPRTGAGVPMTGGLNLLPDLLPQGVTASFPAFDGDSFSAVLPVRPQQHLAPAEALEAIEPLLRAFGFERSLAELGVPAGPAPLRPASLSPLATEVCRETALARDGISSEVCAALRGEPPTPRAEAAFEKAYGIGVAAFQEELERGSLQYSFLQLVEGVPIEGAGVLAFRREGESLSLVHGTLLNRFVVANRPRNDLGALLKAAPRRLERLTEGRGRVSALRPPELVLLPYGAQKRIPALRHAWRVLVESAGGPESWLVWIDAETGAILQASPQWSGATAQGGRWRRDPGLPVDVVDIETDPGLTLELDDGPVQVFRRLDVLGDGSFDDGEVGPADFGQPPIKDPSAAVCKSGGSSVFRQVHTYSHLYSLWKVITSAGTIPAFPEKPIKIWIDFPDPGDKEGNYAYYDASTLLYVDGTGFLAPQCPDAPRKRLNGAQDTTILAHEMSHLSVRRLQERRPPDWCKPSQGSACALPHACGRILFHDFADAFGNAYASTNCFSGWTDKNRTGKDENRYCQGPGPTSEAGGFPRLADVAVDRFPEHRALGSGNYADGQIAAAALWEIRQGMRSKDAASGTVRFWQRLQRALWAYAFVQPTCATTVVNAGGVTTGCTACDRDVYRYLGDLETRMLEQWAVEASPGVPAGAHTANKVLSGWAKAGIFLVPDACLDGDPATQDVSCPAGEGGGDAVIDADDRDEDDPPVDGVPPSEVDYLRRSGPLPGFRVWTGPRFRFDAAGRASAPGPSLCHTHYKVEVSENPSFPSPATRKVEGSTSDCYAEVDFPDWDDVKGAAHMTKVFYYRVSTRDAAGGNERISTSPGAGAFNVPPPFVVVNDTGRP